MRTRPIHYLQYDTRWGYITFSSHSDPKQTIATSGCGAASFAMVAATFLDPNIKPPDIAKMIVDNFFRTYNNGVDWGFFEFAAKKHGLPFKQSYSTDEAIEALKNGALVVASMGPGYFTKTGHYILLWGLSEDGTQILVNDPNSEMRTRASCDIFRQQGRCYFIFYEPEQRKEEKEREGTEKTMPEKWEINVLQEAEQLGLIEAGKHKPEEMSSKSFDLAVALKLYREIQKVAEENRRLRQVIKRAGATLAPEMV